MRRKKLMICFFCVSLILGIAVSMSTGDAENAKIKASEALVEELGAVLPVDDSLVSLYAYHGREAYKKNIDPVLTLGEASDIPVFFTIPPRKMDVFGDSLPSELSAEPLFAFTEEVCEGTVEYIDLYSALLGKGELYFRTDHHWRGEGAYVGYQKIATALGVTPLELERFSSFVATENYLGSDYNKYGDKSVKSVDTLTLYNPPIPCTVTLVSHPYDSEENNVVLDSIYKMECLGYPDKYTVFFGGNAPYITVRGEGERETLLLIRDSFASALVPFLSAHFDLVLLDTRFFPDKVSEVAVREGADKILVLQNMGTLTEGTVKIKY